MYCYWFIGIIGYKAKTIKWRRPFICMPQHCSDTPAERAAALSGSCPGSFPWFIIHVSGLCFSVQITLLISFGEVVLMIWSSLLIIAYNLLLFPGFKRDVILNRWHCTLSARSHPEHQMFFLFFFLGMFCYDCENIALNGQMFLILKPITKPKQTVEKRISAYKITEISACS